MEIVIFYKNTIMKLKFINAFILLMICSVAASAQVVSTDSITMLKTEKNDLKLGKKINDNKLKLAKLENSVQGKEHDLQQANDDSKRSADDNASAASKLSANPTDKSLARRADQTASVAKRDARRARNAAKDVDDLKKDIADLKSKIASDEKKLSVTPVQTNQ